MTSSLAMEAVAAEPLTRTTSEDPEEASERQGRAPSRSSEASRGQNPKRDSSWDKKWQEHLGKNTNEDIPRSSFFARSPRVPGKVNRSVWETRLAQEAKGAKRQMPRTPPPTVARVLKTSRASTASPKPHYGASLTDFNQGSRTATPPYPASECSNSDNQPSDDHSDHSLPPPPPPESSDAKQVSDSAKDDYSFKV